MSTNYEVAIESFAKRHFIKTFAKKYKKAWNFTLSALVREFQSIDVILEKDIAEEITDKNADVVICKTEFRVQGTQESRHGSGNRCIVAKHKNTNKVYLNKSSYETNYSNYFDFRGCRGGCRRRRRFWGYSLSKAARTNQRGINQGFLPDRKRGSRQSAQLTDENDERPDWRLCSR